MLLSLFQSGMIPLLVALNKRYEDIAYILINNASDIHLTDKAVGDVRHIGRSKA